MVKDTVDIGLELNQIILRTHIGEDEISIEYNKDKNIDPCYLVFQNEILLQDFSNIFAAYKFYEETLNSILLTHDPIVEVTVNNEIY